MARPRSHPCCLRFARSSCGKSCFQSRYVDSPSASNGAAFAACGTCHASSKAARERGFDAHGLDIDGILIAHARRHYPINNFFHGTRHRISPRLDTNIVPPGKRPSVNSRLFPLLVPVLPSRANQSRDVLPPRLAASASPVFPPRYWLISRSGTRIASVARNG